MLTVDPAWRLAWDEPGLWVFTGLQRLSGLRRLQGHGGVVIGEVFDDGGASAPSAVGVPPSRSAHQVAESLKGRYWGRYIAIMQDGAKCPSGVFRDPSGALDCLVGVKSAGVAVVTSALPDALLKSVFPRLSVDWETLARQLAAPEMINASSGFAGLTRLTPGSFHSLEPLSSPSQIWLPSGFSKTPATDLNAAALGLEDSVDISVGALAFPRRKVLAEVSGGLDSSIVASALAAASANVVGWLHLTVDDPAADERTYADALAAHLNLDLTVRTKRPPAFSPSVIAEVQTDLSPSFNGMDRDYEIDVLDVADRAGADSVFTGMGGDAVFFQSRTTVMVIDRVRRLGLTGFDWRELEALARRDRRSVWSLLAAGITGREGNLLRGAAAAQSWIRASCSRRPHPWLKDIDALPPAKQLHVEGVVHQLVAYGPSRRGDRLDLIHPLLSQPVLERAFETPVDWLVTGGRDRGLARRAFADRLPPLVLDRRSKADFTGYYASPMAAALPEIRPYLLDGLLAQHDLIDRDALEGVLADSYLAQHGGYSEVLSAVAIEGWARHWDGRLSRPYAVPFDGS